MILDKNLEFADNVALATATGVALLGDVVDLDVARDIGAGKSPLALVIQVTTAITSAGAATVQFRLASDASAAIATDGSATEHGRTDDIPKATLIAGNQHVIIIPPEGFAYERFLGVLSNVGTAALTAGKVNAFLTKDVYTWRPYADASN